VETLANAGEPALNELVQGFRPPEALLRWFDDWLAEEPSPALTDGKIIKEGNNSELDELRSLLYSGKEYLLELQQREITRTGITSLKVAYNNVFGYYIEITHAHKDKVPSDYIRKQTLTNAERYITPELKTYEEKILTAEEKILKLESGLYQDFISGLMKWIPDMQHNARMIATADVLYGFAVQALSAQYCRPEVNEGETLDITEGRHPVIETVLSKEHPYIPNSVKLDNSTQQIIIITGPNMAGKSALLRQTALIVLMAQAGSYVPASAAQIGIADRIFTRVGASDNLSAGESTFMVEMNETARILNTCTSRSLILMDEIGRGTSTYDGVSIAWSLVEYLHETQGRMARTLFATHYHELNDLEGKFPRVKNFNVSVREAGGRILFLRKLIPGGTEHSFGIQVAEMAGMPRQVSERARELLTHFESRRQDQKEAVSGFKFSNRQEVQLNMFELRDEDTLKIRRILAGCDIDRMTPVEALLKLQEIKRELSGEN
jgi:DNA mismatch repair protein MutS